MIAVYRRVSSPAPSDSRPVARRTVGSFSGASTGLRICY
jgi:hypothetical protein